jgi:hypothetical protein
MKALSTRMIWLTAFSIAMGFMETAVVVYLRKIYYPHGFQFPLVAIDMDIVYVEFFREAATIIMLVGIGILAGKNTSQKFAIFIYCFAIWDLFYYVFLKVFLNWPESLFTWDILFLIPVPWVGPVLAPCILSLTMIALTASVIYFQEKGLHEYIKTKQWILLITGSLVVIFSFMLDYFKYLSTANMGSEIWTLSNHHVPLTQAYVPTSFNWWVFALGEIIIVAGIVSVIRHALAQKAEVVK